VSSVLAVFANLLIYHEGLVQPQASGLPLALKAAVAGFVAGYFSDNAFAKLAEIACVLFGSSNRKAAS
jgi:hypothetical protein